MLGLDMLQHAPEGEPGMEAVLAERPALRLRKLMRTKALDLAGRANGPAGEPGEIEGKDTQGRYSSSLSSAMAADAVAWLAFAMRRAHWPRGESAP